MMLGLSPADYRTLRALSTPGKIQDFLDELPINHEKGGETCMSPARVLREQKAHCLEGALLAATCLALQRQKPLIMNLKTARGDDFHAVALFRVHGYWGAISKTNHSVLRFRDPVYRNVRELALSYFHEYFLFEGGKKTLRAYSAPMNLRRFGTKWVSAEEDLWHIADTLATMRHESLVPLLVRGHLRSASRIERLASEAIEWDESDPRT